MAGERDELLQEYQRELAWLRGAGAEFAASYPRLAAGLQLKAGEVADPHVERLIESFAFLTARVQHAFDSDLPEVSGSLLNLLSPHLAEPLPSLSIARFEMDAGAGVSPSGLRIERHTQLLGESHTEGAVRTCRFRTCYPVTLWPVEVTEASLESSRAFDFLRGERDVTAVLRLRLETRGARFQDLSLERLRFFIDGPPEVTFRLYELLSSQATRVALVANPKGQPSAPFFRPGGSLRPVGFGPEEEVLPAPPLHHRALRLLREYFAFPEKFLFFELELGRECVQAATDTLEVLVLLRELGPEDESLPVSPETFRLGCTPIINLFPKVTEPIRLDQRRTEYRLVPDHRRDQEMELHSILSVTASQDDTARTRRVEPIFSWRHGEGGEEPRAFWHARRQPTGREEGSGTEVLLSFVDLDFEPELPADQTLYAHTLCTNGSLPLGMEPNAELQLEERLHVARVSCLRRPTPPRYPPVGGSSLWRLVSTLSLHHLSLTQGEQALEALKELLRLHDPSPGDASEQQLRGMSELSCRRVVRRSEAEGWRGFYRGLELTLTFDEALYVGGSALLLGSVLSHFFGLYASVDSVTQLVAKSKQREGVWKTWPPMAGDQPIL